jgi:hypothetical protein
MLMCTYCTVRIWSYSGDSLFLMLTPSPIIHPPIHIQNTWFYTFSTPLQLSVDNFTYLNGNFNVFGPDTWASKSESDLQRKSISAHFIDETIRSHVRNSCTGWPLRQRSNCSIETTGILPCSEVETLLFRTMWLCSIPPIPCTHSFFQPMSQSRSKPHHAFSHSHVGLWYWVRTISDVNILQPASIHHPESTFHNTTSFIHKSPFKIFRFYMLYTILQFQ